MDPHCVCGGGGSIIGSLKDKQGLGNDFFPISVRLIENTIGIQ